MQFTLRLGGKGGNKLNSFDEGVELAFQHMRGRREWIPLMYYTTHGEGLSKKNGISIGNIASNSLNIRGYNVSYVVSTNDESCEHKLKVCNSVDGDSSASPHWIKFRWLQSVHQQKGANKDRVLLDNVRISAFLTQQQGVILLDDFNNQTTIK